jgi:transcriptional regulator with PAS, ATPase and Fis domain
LNISGFNQSASELIAGLNYKQAIERSAMDILSSYPNLLEVITKESSSNKKLKISRNTEDRFYQAHITTISDRKQKRVGKMLMLNDVTEAVNYEEKLLDKSRQLAELNTFKDKMFNIVAHDIRDPIAV